MIISFDFFAAAGVSVASMAQTKPKVVTMATAQLPVATQPVVAGPRQVKLTEYTHAVPLSQHAYQQMFACKLSIPFSLSWFELLAYLTIIQQLLVCRNVCMYVCM